MYRKLDVLGSGMHGTVHSVVDQQLAMKTYHTRLQQVKPNLLREIDLMATHTCNNIQDLHDLEVTSSGEITSIHPLADGNLTSQVDIDKIAVKTRVRYIQQLVNAVCYLHHHGILHQDLKYDNILVYGETLRLIDFGNSAYRDRYTADSKFKSFASPILCRAPELHTKREFSYLTRNLGYNPIWCKTRLHTYEVYRKAEMYSLGCLMRRILLWEKDDDIQDVIDTFTAGSLNTTYRYLCIKKKADLEKDDRFNHIIMMIAMLTDNDPTTRITDFHLLRKNIQVCDPTEFSRPMFTRIATITSDIQEDVSEYFCANIFKVKGLMPNSPNAIIKCTCLCIAMYLLDRERYTLDEVITFMPETLDSKMVSKVMFKLYAQTLGVLWYQQYTSPAKKRRLH